MKPHFSGINPSISQPADAPEQQATGPSRPRVDTWMPAAGALPPDLVNLPARPSHATQRQAAFGAGPGTRGQPLAATDAPGHLTLFPHAPASRPSLNTRAEMADFMAFELKPGSSVADQVTLNGRQFVSAPLSKMRFARRIVCPAGQPPQPFAISAMPDPETARRFLSDSEGNRAFAHQRLADIDGLMLGRYPATLELFRQRSAAASAYLRRTDPESSDLASAVEHYRSQGGHVLMSAIACGHKTIPEFLNATMPGKYSTAEQVTEWCEQFLLHYGGSGLYEPDDLENRFANHDELQLDTQVLDKFLVSGPPMSDVCVMKGVSAIKSEEASEMSTHVVGRDFARAFLSGQPVMYDGFLSTTFDPKAASDFAGGDPATRAVYAIDFADTSGRSEVLRRHALADLSSDAHPDQAESFMLAIRTRQARGAVLDSRAAPGIGDRKEVLLSTGTVLVGRMAIRCEKGYVILADAYHRDFVH